MFSSGPYTITNKTPDNQINPTQLLSSGSGLPDVAQRSSEIFMHHLSIVQYASLMSIFSFFSCVVPFFLCCCCLLLLSSCCFFKFWLNAQHGKLQSISLSRRSAWLQRKFIHAGVIGLLITLSTGDTMCTW